MKDEVKCWQEWIVIPTYMPALPDKHPMFLEKRVYQGSSGKIYPLPFTDRISETKSDREWKAIFIENRYLKVMILPEIGGRIHAIYDKSNQYDLIYKQEVIKPALVGLAGSWISGGIEFNWAQHHRPATFSPVTFKFEDQTDGSKTVWLGDHEPMSRMKGMHGVCLYPDLAYVELKCRVTNRTPLTQSFLWWVNIATRVHEGYQSFFPKDVDMVADHAKRAMSEYPLCEGTYYGIDYASRGKNGVPAGEVPSRFVPPHCGTPNPKIPDYQPNDLSWYANIPVPTSYMCVGSQEDFFGGYDHLADAGLVHIAEHHISPGKKQWTWGNHDFGYAWDKNLSEDQAPYIELMAGVFTDNQPDFSFLGPWETKAWSQYIYGIGKIGVPQKANSRAAFSIQVGKTIKIGVSVTEVFEGANLRINLKDITNDTPVDVSPGKSLLIELLNDRGLNQDDLSVTLTDRDGTEIISYRRPSYSQNRPFEQAAEPLPPNEIPTIEELFLTGLHLEQYRHATRSPESYWQEALKRDPLDTRSNNALGLSLLRRGEFSAAADRFEDAIKRLTTLNSNPLNGEPYYNLGLALRYQLAAGSSHGYRLFDQAYAAFYKATWNEATASAAYFALAEMDCRANDWTKAYFHLEKSLATNNQNLSAGCLKALVLRKEGNHQAATDILEQNLKTDALDQWSRYLLEDEIDCDKQTVLDIAHNFSAAGFYKEAVRLLQRNIDRQMHHLATHDLGVIPIFLYTLGWLYLQLGDRGMAGDSFDKAASAPLAYCFPYRLEDIGILTTAIHENRSDALAPYYLGNLLFDRKRYLEATKYWEVSASLNPALSIVCRNLGISYFNFEQDEDKALRAYENAFAADKNSRLLYERDQLWKRVGRSAADRLQELEKHSDLVAERDDLTVELCTIFNQLKRPRKALELLRNRHFQPWEGGEGKVLQQFVAANLEIGRVMLRENNFELAKSYFLSCLSPPSNLSETHHLLANKADIFFWLGVAEDKLNFSSEAQKWWELSAEIKGDFQEMSVTSFSEMTFFSALSMISLGRRSEAKDLLYKLLEFAESLIESTAKLDYFATSLPNMLLFDDDIQKRQETKAMFLQAQAFYGLGEIDRAATLLKAVLENDPNYQLALTLLEIEI